MNKEQLQEIVKQKESHTVEFKKSTAQSHSAFQTVCAFLNNTGGIVLIGVTDEGRILGQEVADRTKRELAQEQNKIEPPVNIKIKYVTINEDKQVIVLEVPAGSQSPYAYDGRAFQRDQSVTRRMSQQYYDQLLAKRTQLNYTWERFSATGYSLDMLDENIIFNIVRGAVQAKRLPEIALRQSVPQILEQLDLLKGDQLNHAAVVLFGTKFRPDFPQCQLKMARFKGVTRHEFLDNDLVYNNIFELLERGMLFVKRHLPVAAKIEPGKLERVETPLIPYDAIREALINALCHRDYSIHSGSIGLAIYDDRMELFSDGGLMQGLTLERIKAGFSKPRNPLIADVLYRCNLIERWGRGIQEMITSCQLAGDPEPNFFTDELEFKVVFHFPINISPIIETQQSSKFDIETLSNRQQEILSILQSNREMSLKEIAQLLSDSPAERTLRDDMSRLKKLDLIGSKGQTRGTRWFSKIPKS